MPSVDLSAVALRRARQVVLDHVTVSVDAGEIALLTGARGAGKSSLLAIAAGLLSPDAGQVMIGGRNIVALQSASLPYLRRNIGYLPAQPPFIEEETALENVMLALGVRSVSVGAAAEQARAALDELGLADCADRAVAQLSAAERRLCALARALCGPPPVLVLDDPSIGLDDDDRRRVAQAVRRTVDQGSAILCASSDPDLVAALTALGARRLELAGGRIVGGAPVIRLVVDTDDDIDVSATLPDRAIRGGEREAR
jgi:ABC-type multidrug transport system ATPase subunit